MFNDSTLQLDSLCKDISVHSVLQYLDGLDDERFQNVDPANMGILVGLLKHFGYRRICDLNDALQKGWGSFLAFERNRKDNYYPIPCITALHYVMMIVDPKCRSYLAYLSTDDSADLSKYFRD